MIRNTFEAIRRAYENYKIRITQIMQAYREKVESARSRYNDATFEQEKAAYIENARAQIQEADKNLQSEVNMFSLPKLRRELSSKISEPISDNGFLNTLKTYRDLGVKMQPSEIEAFIARAGGNYAALRVLDSIARDSGYKITMPTVDAYEADIRRLEVRVPMMYAPTEYMAEAKELMNQRPIFQKGQTEAVQFAGTTDVMDFILNAAKVNLALNSMEEIGGRWASTFVPSLEQIADDLAGSAWAEEGAKIQREKALNDSAEYTAIEQSFDPDAVKAKCEAAEAERKAIVSAYM
ncbi:MAG: hypothetical protein IKA47_08270 [Oscillospiraceae bacterium]|nr:hypothetical protein [Oscillospiraceae bacterium]